MEHTIAQKEAIEMAIDIMLAIELQKERFIKAKRTRPNRVIIGSSLLRIIREADRAEHFGEYRPPRGMISGMVVVENERDPEELSVGYAQAVTLPLKLNERRIEKENHDA